jgi:hypothetical protein
LTGWKLKLTHTGQAVQLFLGRFESTSGLFILAD